VDGMGKERGGGGGPEEGHSREWVFRKTTQKIENENQKGPWSLSLKLIGRNMTGEEQKEPPCSTIFVL